MHDSSERRVVKTLLADRVREIRLERYGEHGAPLLARQLRIPPRAWINYESGHTIPGEILLGFIAVTGADPQWLISGHGSRYLPDEVTFGNSLNRP